MSQRTQDYPQQLSQLEVLPLERSVELAAELPQPERLTVTCSPRHGPDESVAIARRLTDLGHDVTVHVAARMMRDRAHLDTLLDRMAQAEADLFLIGGDATPPEGEWSSAVELLPLVAEHPQRPAEIGIAGYPEGHPLIDSGTLADALKQKSALADYITTQLCFDPEALLAWLRDTRDGGVTLPVLVGLPGVVGRRRLLEMSVRIGVGPSLSFLRKQRGLRNLLGPSRVTPDHVYDGLAPYLEDPELNIMGFHYYTFNQVVETWEWEREKRGHVASSLSTEEAASR
jgi:methylenetetrahydrofolate reductase (NADPH)